MFDKRGSTETWRMHTPTADENLADADPEHNLFSLIYNEASSEAYANQISLGTPTGLGPTVSCNQINLGNVGLGSLWYGTIQEAIFYNEDKSSDLSDIEDDIIDYFGIPTPDPDLLLDDFPNAEMAYSLRLLRTAYAGDCMRVERSSDSTQQDIGFVDGYLDVESLLTFAGVGDAKVVTWYDQSGNGYDIISLYANALYIISSGEICKSSVGTIGMGAPATNSGFSTALTLAQSKFLHDDKATILYAGWSNSPGIMLGTQDGYYSSTRIGMCMEYNEFGISNGTGNVVYHDLDGWDWHLENFVVLWDYDVTQSAGSRSYVSFNEEEIVTDTGTLAPSSSDPYAELCISGRGTGTFGFRGNLVEVVVWNDRLDSDRDGINKNVNDFHNLYE